jgi:hypothetical protein
MEDEVAVQKPHEPTAFRHAPQPTLVEQLAVIERASTELRRRLLEERMQIVAQHERRVQEALERHRKELSILQGDLNDRLRENELLSRKV